MWCRSGGKFSIFSSSQRLWQSQDSSEFPMFLGLTHFSIDLPPPIASSSAPTTLGAGYWFLSLPWASRWVKLQFCWSPGWKADKHLNVLYWLPFSWQHRSSHPPLELDRLSRSFIPLWQMNFSNKWFFSHPHLPQAYFATAEKRISWRCGVVANPHLDPKPPRRSFRHPLLWWKIASGACALRN